MTLPLTAAEPAGDSELRPPHAGVRTWPAPVAFALAGGIPYVVTAILECARGWRPAGDNAVISFHAWQTLTLHPPLVGQPILGTTAAPSAHDCGPLLYWLLALPVHLDPTQGALWGAALLCAACTALAVIASWSVRGWPAALGLLGVLTFVIFERPDIIVDPVWNPNIGLVFFMGAGVLGWAVAAGRPAYWPAQVLLASVAAQSHLMFAVGAALSTLIAPLIGMARTRHVSRWLAPGAAVAVACWWAPAVQQLTSRHGNLTALLALHASKHPLGWAYGFRALAAVVKPSGAWVHGTGLGKVMSLLASAGPGWAVAGVMIILGLTALGVVMWLTEHRDQSALCVVLAVLAFSEVWTLASYSPDTVGRYIALGYIVPVMWPLGMAILLGLAWWTGELVLVRTRAVPIKRLPPRWQPSLLLVGALLVCAVPTALGTHAERSVGSTDPPWSRYALIRTVTAGVQRALPPGRVTLVPADSQPGDLGQYDVMLGVLWGLFAAGYGPATNPFYAGFTGLPVSRSTHQVPPPATVVVPASESDAAAGRVGG